MSYFTLDSLPGRTALVEGKEFLFFSGYNYLGMQHVPEFTRLVIEGATKYGWVFPSSRTSNTDLSLYDETEALLSTITGAEDTIIVSSGFTAGRIVVAKWENEIVNLKPSHPAIQSGKYTKQSNIFAVDSVDMLSASITDFSFVTETAEQKTILVDDSHGIGLIGPNGCGIASFLPRNAGIQYVLSYSLSKAFNILGGGISCSRISAKWFRMSPAFRTSTAPSPAFLYALLHGQDLYAGQREKLAENTAFLQSLLADIPGIRSHPLLPVIILPTQIDGELFRQNNIIISSFSYPRPSDDKINRIVVNALHTRADLEYLAKTTRQIMDHWSLEYWLLG